MRWLTHLLSVCCGVTYRRLCKGWQYAQYMISKPLPYQDTKSLKRATDAELRCNHRIVHDRMLTTGCY